MSNTMKISTSFRTAMLKSVDGKHNLGRFGAQVKHSASRHAGVKHVPEWNAHLSFRTAEKLKVMGVLASTVKEEAF